jgi:hypothetical protein
MTTACRAQFAFRDGSRVTGICKKYPCGRCVVSSKPMVAVFERQLPVFRDKGFLPLSPSLNPQNETNALSNSLRNGHSNQSSQFD